VVVAGLLVWIVILGVSLPTADTTRQWRLLWIGFDTAEVAALGVTLWAVYRSRQLAIPAALITGTLFACDAWFDVVLSWGTHGWWFSLATAVLVELPLAALLWGSARSMAHAVIAAPALRLQQLDVVVGDEYDGQPRAVHADLHREQLLRERIHIVLPADHPEAAGDPVPIGRLADVPWAACQPGTGHREMHVRACRELGDFEPDLRYSSDDFLILLELVRTTGAGALLPDLVLGYGAPGVAVRVPAEGELGREVFLLTRRSRTPAVAAVAAALRGAADVASLRSSVTGCPDSII